MFPPPLPFSIRLEVLTNAVRQEKEIKGIQIEMEEIKLCLQMNTCRKSQRSDEKELISSYSKISGGKLITKSVTLLYTSNE